jgi:hypothetical protein
VPFNLKIEIKNPYNVLVGWWKVTPQPLVRSWFLSNKGVHAHFFYFIL